MCARINTAFINPYNFIPFDNRKQVSRPETERGELSGVISYSIYTKTPLIIPNTSNPDTFKMAISHKEGDDAERSEEGQRKEDREEENRNEQEDVQKDIQKDARKDIHKSYDFFSYDDLAGETDDLRTTYRRPVIPGSELRGLIRNQYEILTDSCLSSVDTDDVLSKRTQEKYKAGLLKKTAAGYELYEAEDCLLRTHGRNSLSPDLTADWENDSSTWSRECYIQNQLKEGERVWVRKHQRGYRIKPLISDIRIVTPGAVRPNGWLDGYVLKGVAGPDMSGNKQNKHCCHIFLPGRNHSLLSGLDCNEALSRLEYILDAYEKNGESDYSEYRSALNAFKNGRMNSCFPVYYSFISEVRNGRNIVLSVTLSPAVITRESYTHTVKDMVGSHTPCSDPDHLCPACTLFGTIGKGRTTFQKTSRIRVCDAFLDQRTTSEEAFRFDQLPQGLPEGSYDLEHGIFTLQPLSSPKLNNLEFYLKRPDGAWFWTYDYMIDQNGNLAGIAPSLNGRKFYWHNMAWYRNALISERSNQNMSVRPVAPGNVFHGKLFFDHLTAEELNMLCFVLNAGEKTRETLMEDGSLPGVSEKEHGYKLGAAKPLGFGSISVQIEGVKIHCMRLDQEVKKITMQDIPYTEYDPDGYKEPQIDQSILSDFMKMTDFRFIDHNAPGIEVRYPVTDKPDEPEIFKWFVANHSGYRRRGDGPIQEIGMPNSRNTMVYKHYLSPMEPRLQSTGFEETVYGRGRNGGQARDDRQAGNGGQARNIRQAGTRGGVQKELSVWAAQYGLKNRDSLPLIDGRKIYYESTGEWATADNLKTYAAGYRTVLLPGKTSDHLKNLASELFDHVLVATKGDDGKDNGWLVLK